jgi:glycosyltransferase involved in cell wall biosynthesis
MRLTFILPPLSSGGGTRVVLTYASLLRERGHEVHVLSKLRPPGSFKGKLKFLLKHRQLPPEPERNVYPELMERLAGAHRTFSGNLRETDVPDADFIIATWWETAEWIEGLPSSKGSKVHLLQDYEMFPYLPLERVARTYMFDALRIAVSSFIRDKVALNHGVSGIHVIPNAVDGRQFHTPVRSKSSGLTIGFMHQSRPDKNPRLALDVVADALQRFPGVRVVGFGREGSTQEYRIPNEVDFRIRPPQSEIPHLYGACDVWLFTSRSEGFGLPILEAMSCRTPVIATRAGAAADLIRDGENGYLVDADVGSFRQRIAQMHEMLPSGWQQMSERAFSTAHSWSWDDAAARFEGTLMAEMRS